MNGGATELYENGERDRGECRWGIRGQQPPGKLVDIREEVHIEYMGGSALILRINPDYSLTSIAEIMDEKRRDYLKDEQKIKLVRSLRNRSAKISDSTQSVKFKKAFGKLKK